MAGRERLPEFSSNSCVKLQFPPVSWDIGGDTGRRWNALVTRARQLLCPWESIPFQGIQGQELRSPRGPNRAVSAGKLSQRVRSSFSVARRQQDTAGLAVQLSARLNFSHLKFTVVLISKHNMACLLFISVLFIYRFCFVLLFYKNTNVFALYK